MNNYSNETQIPTYLYCLESMRGAVASFRNYLQRSIKSTIAYVAFYISHLKTLVKFSILPQNVQNWPSFGPRALGRF